MEISDTTLASALIKLKTYEISCIPNTEAIDHSFSEEFEEKMSVLITSFDKKIKNNSVFRTVLTKAAIIILTLSFSAFSFIMINPRARADFRNAIFEFYENHIKIHFVTVGDSTTGIINLENIYPDYIPYGFIMTDKHKEYEAISYTYTNNAENLSYDIYISLNEGLAVHTDKNKNNIKELKISEKEAYLISGENNGKPYSTLIITDNEITVTIYGQLTENEIIKVGESVKEE